MWIIRHLRRSQEIWKEPEKYLIYFWKLIEILSVLMTILLRAIETIFNRMNIAKLSICGKISTQHFFLLPANLNCRRELVIHIDTSMSIGAHRTDPAPSY